MIQSSQLVHLFLNLLLQLDKLEVIVVPLRLSHLCYTELLDK